MEIGKISPGSQLLQRNVNIESVAPRERANAEGNQGGTQRNEQGVLSKEKAKQMTKSLNHVLDSTKTSLHFEFHEKLEEYYVSIINPDTKEIIKEIPPRKLLDIYAAMAEFMGFIVDKKI
ncbi:flagellar protein FlaG [Salirhabdus euzebyi]|uniref:Flagellar protein FlaG n=1 Tax=Salirhabdus euzebyi TaxID=394506 RepID=A0A841Q5F7_9BACI|nr:flagellar protein FlaG [Salirhabdus euzebyi]MBB6453620.1 flagellar protein FlaG [Salirhabdus euzebyi]